MFAPNTMQKLFFAVPAFILFAGTIFSETTFSPSLDFRSGILMYEAGRSSFSIPPVLMPILIRRKTHIRWVPVICMASFRILYFAEMFMQALLIFHSPAIFTRSEPVEARFLFLMKCASSMENRISYCRD